MSSRKQLLLAFFIVPILCFSQDPDSIPLIRVDSSFLDDPQEVEIFTEMSKLDPVKSAMYSAVLPGLGQAYNGQHWKMPIVYGGFIVFGHFIRYNDRLYQSFRSAILAETDSDPNTINPYPLSETVLKRQAEVFRRDRDYLIILTALFYLLQVADAHISAHLNEFQINKDLALDIVPTTQQGIVPNSVGIGLRFRF